jgi:AcrR family transcriptional regulator
MADVMELSRRERNKLDTKAKLLKAASKLFSEKGVPATTVDEIAETADVARATFFNYFQTKNAVLHELWVEQMSAFTRAVEDQISLPIPTLERLRGLFEHFVREVTGRPAYYRAVMAELELDWSKPEISKIRIDRFHEPLERLVDAGVAQGDVRTDYDGEFLAQMIGGVYVAIMRSWRLDPNFDMAGRFDDAAQFLGEALRPRGN